MREVFSFRASAIRVIPSSVRWDARNLIGGKGENRREEEGKRERKRKKEGGKERKRDKK